MGFTRLARRALIGAVVGCIAHWALAEAPTIDHKAVGCIVVGKFPRFEARFAPAEKLSRARVRFRPGGGTHWYSVGMAKKEGEVFTAVLPKPTPKLKQLDYYVEVTATDFATGRSQEYAPVVVSGLGACQGDKIVAEAVSAAKVLLEVPAGAPAVPAGFSSAGIVMAAPGAGAAAGGAAGSGGVSTGAVLGGVAVAGAAAGVAARAGGGDDTLPPANRPPDAVFRVTPEPPSGAAPLSVTFNMCDSADPDSDRLFFRYDFGDGERDDQGACSRVKVYQSPAIYNATMCVTDQQPGHERCQSRGIQVLAGDVSMPSRQSPVVPPLTYRSILDVTDGQGQLVFDGQIVTYTRRVLHSSIDLPAAPMHRLEAQLVIGMGEPGTWRFDFGGGFRPGTLHVIAGDAAEISSDFVVFRVRGEAGQRIVLGFSMR